MTQMTQMTQMKQMTQMTQMTQIPQIPQMPEIPSQDLRTLRHLRLHIAERRCYAAVTGRSVIAWNSCARRSRRSPCAIASMLTSWSSSRLLWPAS